MKKGFVHGYSTRPASWCIEAGCSLTQSKCYNEDSLVSDLSEDGLIGRAALVRSSSYQALHSALARLYRLDDFHLERIGQGFFSEVFKARHIATGKIMVLKMNKLFSNRHNMLREVELMNRLHHPNILNYYGVCVHEGQVHALTQYINGGSLDVLLQNRRIELSWLSKISLALDISKGMSYLHSKRVFHRDLTSKGEIEEKIRWIARASRNIIELSVEAFPVCRTQDTRSSSTALMGPKNILIKHTKENGRHRLRAVIADFGLAAPIPQDKSIRLRQVGSPYWMAPEVIRGDWYDHRADVFSFGIITCEIIARCDADPDVLPRTHNFGVHYLAFSRMCQSDCPPSFLEIAFQCSQIDPNSRPSFDELEKLLSYLITEYWPIRSPHIQKTKVYHKRSLSDESCVLVKNGEAAASSVLTANSLDQPSNIIGTPQEVLERLSAADPYFHPTSATVNPFSQVKLPAKSQLILQEGGRFCHSMPDLRTCHLYQTPVSLPAHILSYSCFHSVESSPTQCVHESNNAVFYSVNDNQCNCRISNSCKKNSFDKIEGNNSNKCEFATVADKKTATATGSRQGNWSRDSLLVPNISEIEGVSGLSPRVDIGSSHNGSVRRRGSGESGFFSVEDVERIGTPELCLSYSELSTASVVSTEEEDCCFGHHLTFHRSPSVVTDSSEDLSSLGCCHDQNCDLASLPDYDHPGSHVFNSECSTDIKSIVEFFERGYGSLRSISEQDRRLSTHRKDCLVPILRSHFNASGTHRPFLSSSSFTTTCIQRPLFPADSFFKPGSSRPVKSEKKEAVPKIRERPKVYITEGTVRAKRNIFESK